ncbi:carbohydrate kinase [Halovulum dunhuangense]|uniref:Carbohydrate kinase n=1 Tax=Halovulum dunhuangense TaxID=1505036 RepID=A0A849L477_9RHOB|nr:PfkB family carbohydrate kinase [Halovulum dunhuangense]NNU80957.1 carbohydrate kinase [Halovulum dunhuangense]
MIIVGGENLIDFIQDAPDGGHPAYRAVPGGAPFNVAKAIARQDVAMGYLTPFSTDTLGRQLQADLLANPRAQALHTPSDRPTSLAVVSLEQGQARYQFYRERTAERDVTPESLRAALPVAPSAFFVGSLAVTDGPDAEAWAGLFRDLSQAGTFTALDPNIRAAFIHDRAGYLARLETLIATADLIKMSDEDIAWLAPGQDPRAALRAIAGRSRAGLVVLTLGAKGAFGITRSGEIEVPPHPVPKLVDTVGAGDTFMGTLIAQCHHEGWLRRGALDALTPDQARLLMRRAAAAAAINCGRAGCNPPSLSELRAAL